MQTFFISQTSSEGAMQTIHNTIGESLSTMQKVRIVPMEREAAMQNVHMGDTEYK